MHNKLPIILVVVLTASMLLVSSSVYASGGATSSATVSNAAPTVGVGLAPDDNTGAPGVQVINENWQTQNRTVTITATVTDMNGWDDLTGIVTAVITGPDPVNDSPVSLSFDHNISVATAVYTGIFNMSDHADGDYTVEVTAYDAGGFSGTGSENFTYLHTAGDFTPPAVTDPVADPAIIANGVEESELSVNVTDASEIYAVTIDLSPIGGNSTQLMTNIAGTDTYTTTTTATVGTAPGMYGLPVNATDNSPNRNENTSVSILLTVLPNEVVTTYNFTTGAGSDKKAFGKQHFNKPPLDNGDPDSKFKASEYEHIKVDDGAMEEDATSSKGFYAIHRFDIDIAESRYAITKIDILWDGKGKHDYFGGNGATLYIWNFETGAYEQLDNSTDIIITLEGSVIANITDYLGPDGNLIFIAEQNTAQQLRYGLKLYSRLGTDYVNVEVTHIPQPEVIVLNVTPSKIEVNRSEDMTFAIDVRNDGAPGYGYVGGAACYLEETYCNTEWKMTDYLNTGDTYTAHLNWTVPADAPLSQYDFLSKTWDACWSGCEGTPCYSDECCDGMQDKYGADGVFEVVS